MAGAHTRRGYIRYNTPIAVHANGAPVATFCDEDIAVEWATQRSEIHPRISYSISDLRDPHKPAKVIRKDTGGG